MLPYLSKSSVLTYSLTMEGFLVLPGLTAHSPTVIGVRSLLRSVCGPRRNGSDPRWLGSQGAAGSSSIEGPVRPRYQPFACFDLECERKAQRSFAAGLNLQGAFQTNGKGAHDPLLTVDRIES